MAHRHNSSRTQDPPRFIEERAAVTRAAQDVHEQHYVKCTFTERQLASIGLGQKSAIGSGTKLLQHRQRHIYANVKVSSFYERSSNPSRTRANIKHTRRCGNACGSMDGRANALRDCAG